METRILFVDDENEILRNYQNLFEDGGKSESERIASALFEDEGDQGVTSTTVFNYEVFTARQGDKAVEIVEDQIAANEPIDIVFLDMRMPPGIDGGETARRIKHIDPKIEIVIATAYADIDLNSLVETIGQPDKLLFLKKPFSSDEVIQMARNLSEKKRLENAQDRLLHNVSHELRTPLTSILGFSKLIQSENLGAEALNMAEIIERNAYGMELLISDLIDTSLLDLKRLSFSFSENSIESILKGVKALYPADEDVRRLHIKVEPEIPNVRVDLERFVKAISCLISNGLKFSDDDVEVVFSQTNNELQVDVIDHGVGIASEFYEPIFRRFYCIDLSHEKKGMGLGLALCKQIINHHKGRVSVKSVVKEGSTFTIRIPVSF